MADLERMKEVLPLAAFFEDIGVELRGSGEDLTGLCPFHPDKDTPSLIVHPGKGTFHCFGCSAGGDLFSAVQLHLNCDFKESVAWVADKTGVPVEPPVKEGSRLPLPKAVEEFHVKLRHNPEAMEYLTSATGKRRLNAETVARFKLGWDGEWYSVPYADGDGRAENIKMIHPDKAHEPRQKFYAKGKAVKWFPADAFAQHSELVAVGGEWDALKMQQEGFGGAVCWGYGEGGLKAEVAVLAKGKRVTLLLDADEAGRAATRRSASLLMQAGASVQVVEWQKGDWGKDATDFLISRGADELRRLIQDAVPPAGGVARMGGYVYWEGEDGYYRGKEGKDEDQGIRLTDFAIRYNVVWEAEAGAGKPQIDGLIVRGGKSYPFLWDSDVFADNRKFAQELLKLCPLASFSASHLGDVRVVLSQLNPNVPQFSSVSGPGYAGMTYVTPTVLVREGQCLPNAGQIRVLNEEPSVKAYDLEMPPQKTKLAVDALMQVLSVHDYAVTVPILAHLVSAPVIKRIAGNYYCMYITGATGVGKTMVCKCLMNLFMTVNPMAADTGKILAAIGTANSLERIAWDVQDSPVLIDDVKVGLTDMMGIARLIHNHYDMHGRTRMTASLDVTTTWYVRGLLIITGEQLPTLKGPHASVIRRGLIVEIPPEGLRLDMAEKVWELNPLLRGLMAGFIAWSQVNPPPIKTEATPTSTAERFGQQAVYGLGWFLDFCKTWGMEESTADDLLKTARKSFALAVYDSEQEQATLRDTESFIAPLLEGLASGRLTLDEPRSPGQRRIGCWWNSHAVLFPGEVTRWTEETGRHGMNSNNIGRALKSQGLLIIKSAESTPSTLITTEGKTVRVWVLQDSVIGQQAREGYATGEQPDFGVDA